MNRVLFGDMAALVIAAGVLTYVTILFVRFMTKGIKVFDTIMNKNEPVQQIQANESSITDEVNTEAVNG